MSYSDQIHIASFILQTQRSHVEMISNYLSVFTEVEIVKADISGKVVFLVEAPNERRVTEIVDALRDLPAVLSVMMVEHHADDPVEMFKEL